MIYAEVVIKQRTGADQLTYEIPAPILPYLKVGSLVVVPVRRRSVTGVVVALKRQIEPGLRGKTRAIIKVERKTVLGEGQIEVMKRLAAFYGASHAEVAFHALKYDYVQESGETRKVDKPIMIQALKERRYQEYLKLIRANPKRSFLLLFAQKSFAAEFSKKASAEAMNLLVGEGNAKQRSEVQATLLSGQRFVLVGTIQQAFFPLRSGDIIIVDQPSHVGAKQQQRPFMRLGRIAKIRAETEKLQLITGDILSEVEQIPQLIRKSWRLKNYLPEIEPLLIFNRQGTRTLLTPGIEAEFKTRSKGPGKILVIVLSRGIASALVCVECGHVMSCGNCGRTISVTSSRLLCRYCRHEQPMPRACPACRGLVLRPVGEGVEQVVKEIKSLLPKLKVVQYSSDQPGDPSGAKIVVATEKIFNHPGVYFESAFFLSVDRLMSGIETQNSWELMYYLLSTPKAKIVQTYFPEHRIWSYTGQGGLKKFFTDELRLRRRYRLPPFGVLFDLVGQAHNQTALYAQAEMISAKLADSLANVEIGLPELTRQVSGQYIARLKALTPKLSDKQKEIVRDELPPNWHLDIEP